VPGNLIRAAAGAGSARRARPAAARSGWLRGSRRRPVSPAPVHSAGFAGRTISPAAPINPGPAANGGPTALSGAIMRVLTSGETVAVDERGMQSVTMGARPADRPGVRAGAAEAGPMLMMPARRHAGQRTTPGKSSGRPPGKRGGDFAPRDHPVRVPGRSAAAASAASAADPRRPVADGALRQQGTGPKAGASPADTRTGQPTERARLIRDAGRPPVTLLYTNVSDDDAGAAFHQSSE
jgi:hypothetical protein